jgi:hypothetical protein
MRIPSLLWNIHRNASRSSRGIMPPVTLSYAGDRIRDSSIESQASLIRSILAGVGNRPDVGA